MAHDKFTLKQKKIFSDAMERVRVKTKLPVHKVALFAFDNITWYLYELIGAKPTSEMLRFMADQVEARGRGASLPHKTVN